MKKAAKAIPNKRLREAREIRGWSQKYVAERIGADDYYLSRWERGTALPSPYYRQQLCVLFGKNARELGLLPEDVQQSEQEPVSEERAGQIPALSHAAARIHDPAIPPPSTGGMLLVGRDELLTRLKGRLCGGQSLVLSALNGIPGVGKTTLALALAHDEEVHTHFHDGVLWVGLGPGPDIPGQLSRWGALLGVSAVGSGKQMSIEAWTQALHEAIGTRQMLLIIDDAWKIEEALAFKVGGPNCAYLVTTRFPHIALQFAADGATLVQELNEQDSMVLLAQLAPEVVESEAGAVRELVQAVGGLPLALTLMGKYLHTQTYSGQPRRIHAAIERLRDAEARLRLSEPQALLERSPSLARETAVSLQTIIAVSDQLLDERAKAALRALAVFPAKPNSFSEEAALAVCAAPVETLDILSDAGLLESRGPGRYTLHQTIADYAGLNLADVTPYKRMVEYFADYVETNEKHYEALEQEAANVFAALQAAHERGWQEALVRGVNAFAHFLETRGLYSQAETHLNRSRQAAVLLYDRVGLATTLLYLGEIAEKHGENRQAEAYLQEGLALARQAGNRERIIDTLRLLGLVTSRHGSYAQAEAHLREALALARQVEDRERISAVLRTLGTIVSWQGNNDEAKTYFKEGLALARQVRDRPGISVLLTNLGSVAIMQRDYDQAEAYLQEGLEMARQAGHRQHISVLLTNLGEVAGERGDYVQAEAYLEEGLIMARQLGHQWFISNILGTYGELYLKQQRLDEAEAAFHETREQAPEGAQERIAESLYGLARVALARGNASEALRQGRRSLAIFEAAGHGRAAEVRQWLATSFPQN